MVDPVELGNIISKSIEMHIARMINPVIALSEIKETVKSSMDEWLTIASNETQAVIKEESSPDAIEKAGDTSPPRTKDNHASAHDADEKRNTSIGNQAASAGSKTGMAMTSTTINGKMASHDR